MLREYLRKRADWNPGTRFGDYVRGGYGRLCSIRTTDVVRMALMDVAEARKRTTEEDTIRTTADYTAWVFPHRDFLAMKERLE